MLSETALTLTTQKSLVGSSIKRCIWTTSVSGSWVILVSIVITLWNGTYADPVQSGNVDIELKFAKAHPGTVRVFEHDYYEQRNSPLLTN